MVIDQMWGKDIWVIDQVWGQDGWIFAKFFLVQSALLGWLWELPAAKEVRRYGAMALWRYGLNFNVCLIN